MSVTLAELAEIVGGKLKGDGILAIEGVCSLEHPKDRCIAFAESAGLIPKDGAARPAAVIITEHLSGSFADAIIAENPRLAFVQVIEHFLAQEPQPKPAVSPPASVSPKASLGSDVSVGEFAVVCAGASIGDGVRIDANCFIGESATIGAKTRLHPGVKVLERCVIGEHCIINAGTVIGAEGYGFVSTAEGHRKFPQLGRVVVGDDVEIGACCTIDRAALDETRIGRGCKIDNLVQIAHNVHVGEHTLIAAQCGIAGRARIGSWCVIGGQVGIQGGIEVGDRCVIAGQSGVFGSLPAGSKVSGYPAKPHQQAMRVLALTQKLPELTEKLKALEEELRELKRKGKGKS
jgi:UDP-3-O-[3-hydroxymyristoyl] glucosamine N-acyltransferase